MIGVFGCCTIVNLMIPALLLAAESHPAQSSDTLAWWEVVLIVTAVLGSLAAIVTMLMSLVSFKPLMRKWRESVIGRMTAWRWATPRMRRFMRGEATVVDRVGTRVVFRLERWLMPRDWRMTEDGEAAWKDRYVAGIEEYARRREARRCHHDKRRRRRALRRKRCADCGRRCDAGGTLFDDGSAVCGDCDMQRLAAKSGTQWVRENHGSGFHIRRVPVEPNESETRRNEGSDKEDPTARET